MSELVQIKNVCKVYNPGENEVRALDDVSVSIDSGEFVAIIGQSGSGKSTLMNMLGCLDVPSSGLYMLHGQDVSTLDDDELSDIRNREIGFIFQGFNLIANLTALENVELPLIYRGVSRSKRIELSEKALEKVGLGHRMDHKPSEMSGGQQQRVAIARAIAQAPPIILADEPTGNLDSNSSKEIMQILKNLYAEGRTVILITHDNEIANQAKRVIKIRDGHIESDSKDVDGTVKWSQDGRQNSEGKNKIIKDNSVQKEIESDYSDKETGLEKVSLEKSNSMEAEENTSKGDESIKEKHTIENSAELEN